MGLTSGTRLGPYEIVSAIGAGGMGEVYRAKDARLHRDVAVKVLAASIAADADRRARFEREAHAIAALSHPNVVAIFDTGQLAGEAGSGPEAGLVYLVMELLTGETLRARLATGALPVKKAVDIAVQIARGLGAAHGKGVIHRDLKPENIFLLDDGQVKILDFGLARQFDERGDGATHTVATDPGTVMGTIGYMSPEQVRGQLTDARTDVFAFGAVLYEMVSGQRAYQRDTAADTMTAILTQEPPELSASRADVPASLDRIVRHCLEKNVNERFQSARDIAFALDALSGTGVSVPSSAVPIVPAPAPRRRWLWPAVTAVLMLATAAGTVVYDRRSGGQAADIVFAPKTWDLQTITNARFGPDGQTIVFSAATAGSVPSLYVVRPGEVAQQRIAGPGTQLLSVSATGELAVLTSATHLTQRVYTGTLGRMTMTGAVRPWLEHVTEADWSPDGSTLAVIRNDGGGWRIEYPVGTTIYSITAGYLSDLRVSPDGQHVAFFEHQFSDDDRGWVKVVDRSGPASAKTLAGEFAGEEGAAWSRDSRTLYFSAGNNGSQSHAVRAVQIGGSAAERRAVGAPEALMIFDVAADGRMLIVQQTARSSIRVGLPGQAEREFPWLDFANFGLLSADGTHLAFTDISATAGTDYAVGWRDTADGPVVRLGRGVAEAVSPDGKWVVSLIPSSGQVVAYPTGPGDPITLAPVALVSVQWGDDAEHVLLCGRLASAPTRCYRTSVRGTPPEPVTPEGTTFAKLAHDRRTMLVRGQGGFQIMSMGDQSGRAAAGLTGADKVLEWSLDNTSVYVASRSEVPARVERVNVTTGVRTFVKALSVSDPLGVGSVGISDWRDDGRMYAYSYVRVLSQLFAVSGAK